MSAPRVSPESPFARALSARREGLNALFRREGRGVDPDAFLAYLERDVAPMVNRLAATAEVDAEPLTVALYRVSLRAFRLSQLAPGDALSEGESPARALHRALHEALPALLPTFPERPRDLALALANAALRLHALGPARAEAWLDAMIALGPSAPDLPTLFDLGLVLAWREGVAEARREAMARFDALPPMLRRGALGTETLLLGPERRFAAPTDAGRLTPPQVLHRLGGFIGFDGVFREPPLVVVADGRLYAFDSCGAMEVHADAFGASLTPVSAVPSDASEPDPEAFSLDASGRVHLGGAEATLPALHDSSSAAYADGVAVVTLPCSHFVFVLGRHAEGAP